MKKLTILLPIQVAETIAQRALQSEAILDFKVVSVILAPNDMAAVLALQNHPVLSATVFTNKTDLLAIWKHTCDQSARSLATLDSILAMSETSGIQTYADSFLEGMAEKDCYIVKSMGGDVTSIVLMPGVVEHLRDHTNHLPLLKKLLANKLIGKKISDVFKHDAAFVRAFVRYSARFGAYLPPTPVA